MGRNVITAAVLFCVFFTGAAFAETNTFTMSGYVFDVVSSDGVVHTVDYWEAVPVTNCVPSDNYTLYLNINGKLVPIGCPGTMACYCINKRPGTRVIVTGFLGSKSTGYPGSESLVANITASQIN